MIGLGLGGGIVEFCVLVSVVLLKLDDMARYPCAFSFWMGPFPDRPRRGIESTGRKTEPAIRTVRTPALALQGTLSRPVGCFAFKIQGMCPVTV